MLSNLRNLEGFEVTVKGEGEDRSYCFKCKQCSHVTEFTHKQMVTKIKDCSLEVTCLGCIEISVLKQINEVLEAKGSYLRAIKCLKLHKNCGIKKQKLVLECIECGHTETYTYDKFVNLTKKQCPCQKVEDFINRFKAKIKNHDKYEVVSCGDNTDGYMLLRCKDCGEEFNVQIGSCIYKNYNFLDGIIRCKGCTYLDNIVNYNKIIKAKMAHKDSQVHLHDYYYDRVKDNYFGILYFKGEYSTRCLQSLLEQESEVRI